MSDAGRQRWDADAECLYSVSVSKSDVDGVKWMFDLEKIMDTGCRVLKHPDCCVLCAANNDCKLLPLHFRCRCRPEGYLKFAE